MHHAGAACGVPVGRQAGSGRLRPQRRRPKTRLRCSLEPEASARPSAMQLTLPTPAEHWLFGADPKQRVRARRTLLACGIYVLAAIGQ